MMQPPWHHTWTCLLSFMHVLGRFTLPSASQTRPHLDSAITSRDHCVVPLTLTSGVGWVRLSTPHGAVDVLNTHLHANYSHIYRAPPRAARQNPLLDPDVRVPADGTDAAVRIAQLLELAQVG